MPTKLMKKFSLAPGKIEPLVLQLIENINKVGDWPRLIDLYAGRGEIEQNSITQGIKRAMVEYLIDRDVTQPSEADVAAGNYDEYFALAYNHAISVTAAENDPIDNIFFKGSMGAWDFSVETFDDFTDQGIIPENILAAGAIDYVYELGVRLGIYRLVDALILNWSSGAIDVTDAPVEAKLYRYWKLSEQRFSMDELLMLTKRVLNKGSGEVLNRMVINDDFQDLWHNLMAEVADYIDKTERLSEGISEISPVSRSRIYQATKELQFNLSDACTGIAHMQIREAYAQMQEAIEILRDPDILAYFGGNKRKSMWTVIDQLSRDEFGTSPNIAAHRSLAVDGNKIFQWIANFNEGTVRQEDFVDVITATESYILNYPLTNEGEDYIDEDDDFDSFDSDDDFFESEDDDF